MSKRHGGPENLECQLRWRYRPQYEQQVGPFQETSAARKMCPENLKLSSLVPTPHDREILKAYIHYSNRLLNSSWKEILLELFWRENRGREFRQEDRAVISLHLFNTMVFLMTMVILLVLYGSFYGYHKVVQSMGKQYPTEA
ncbi:unnamed protein product [Cyprideis torosa]|uniref:Uncharacterized protein n=1 Tax=Cyprideis torosa TaxID=163714 RepID=A0A7R8ZPP4_9CRUS|nr:unnamed protein product [Cyprideis torosa]CAG0901047.1 unnamed protein product [Cyprideis torosa]